MKKYTFHVPVITVHMVKVNSKKWLPTENLQINAMDKFYKKQREWTLWEKTKLTKVPSATVFRDEWDWQVSLLPNEWIVWEMWPLNFHKMAEASLDYHSYFEQLSQLRWDYEELSRQVSVMNRKWELENVVNEAMEDLWIRNNPEWTKPIVGGFIKRFMRKFFS